MELHPLQSVAFLPERFTEMTDAVTTFEIPQTNYNNLIRAVERVQTALSEVSGAGLPFQLTSGVIMDLTNIAARVQSLVNMSTPVKSGRGRKAEGVDFAETPAGVDDPRTPEEKAADAAAGINPLTTGAGLT